MSMLSLPVGLRAVKRLVLIMLLSVWAALYVQHGSANIVPAAFYLVEPN